MSSFSMLERLLPTEIITIILELVCESHCSHILASLVSKKEREFAAKFYQDTTVYDPIGKDLLTTIHISSRLRGIAFGHAPIWRAIANVIMAQADLRDFDHTTTLLQLCTYYSRNTFDRLDFRAWSQSSRCSKRIETLIDVVAGSAPSIKQLDFTGWPNSLPPNGLQPCDCPSCQTDDNIIGSEYIWNSIFDLIYHATSLDHLNLGVPRALPSRVKMARQAATLRARPTEVRLYFIPDVNLSQELESFLNQLVSRPKALCIESRRSLRRHEWNLSTAGWIASLVESAAQSIQHFELQGAPHATIVHRVLSIHWTQLQSIQVDILSPEVHHGLLPQRRVICSIPTLSAYQGPAWMLPHLRIPHLKRATVAMQRIVDDGIVSEQLPSWNLLEELVFYLDLNDLEPGPEDHQIHTDMLQSLIRSLIPLDGQACLCPLLSRLGLSDHRMDFKAWMNGEDVSPRNNWYDGKIFDDDQWHLVPLIGADLLRLDRRRRELSSQQPLPDTSTPICRSLSRIYVMCCLVDPTIWDFLMDTPTTELDLWCRPDPTEVRQKMMEEGDPYELFKFLPEALFRLNNAA